MCLQSRLHQQSKYLSDVLFPQTLAAYRVGKMFGFGKERVQISQDSSSPSEEKGNQERSEKN